MRDHPDFASRCQTRLFGRPLSARVKVGTFCQTPFIHVFDVAFGVDQGHGDRANMIGLVISEVFE